MRSFGCPAGKRLVRVQPTGWLVMKRGACRNPDRPGLLRRRQRRRTRAGRPGAEKRLRRARAGVVKAVGCNGMCHREPMVEVVEPGGRATLYGNVTAEAARRIVRRHIRPRRLFTWARWSAERVATVRAQRVPLRLGDYRLDRHAGAAAGYLARQKRIVLENCGEIDPLNIDDYLARDGYRALARCLEDSSPEEVIAAISNSGLRGRGGAGFPTGRKWSLARAQTAPAKYVICNGDEGDPGAFMDRLVLESDPHRVLEGLAIAAYAIGAAEGFFYIRAEYPLAVRHVAGGDPAGRGARLPGRNILGSDSRCGWRFAKAPARSSAARRRR